MTWLRPSGCRAARLASAVLVVALSSGVSASLGGVAHATGVADHLVAHWAFDETVAGSNAEDSVGSNDGVPTNDPAPSTDVPPVSFDDARSASFNGSNYFTFDRPVSTDFTVCAWVKTTSTGGGVNHWTSAPILDSETGGVAYDLGFGVGNGGKLMFGNGGLVAGNMVDRQVNGTTTINDDTWHNVCATRNNSSGEVDLYVDAKLDGSGTTGTGALTSNPHARVGYGYDGAALFQGLIDDVRIYDVVLTADQLTNLTDGSADPDSPPKPPLAPTVTPADDATGVAVGSNLTLAFNRAPTAGTGNIEIHRADDDSTVATIAADDTDHVSISGSNVTVNPAANLDGSTAYYVLIAADAFKDSDGDFYAGISDPTAWSFTTAPAAVSAPAPPEGDGDGIDDSVEAAAPNGGDANGDGVPDSAQPNVSSFPNPETGAYVSVAVTSDCTLSNVGMASQRSGAGDPGFTYPVGLVDFTAHCTAGASTSVSVYFSDPPTGDLVVRKFDPATNTFTSVDNAKLTWTTIGGKPVTVASYVVVDGGPLDSDHIVNGTVVDPVGLAQVVEVPPTASPTPAGTTPGAAAAAGAGTGELPYTGATGAPTLTAVATILTAVGLFMLLAARRPRDERCDEV